MVNSIAKIDVQQKLDAAVYAVQINTGDRKIAAAVRANGDQTASKP